MSEPGKILGVFLVEGFVESDPMTVQTTIRTVDENGKDYSFDVQAAFKSLEGQEVRFVLTPLATLAELNAMAAKVEALVGPVEVVDEPGEN